MCLKAARTLAASCAPPSNPLSPSWAPPHLQLRSRCQRDSCAPQRAVFWVLEQGGRPRQQLPLCIYIISVIPSTVRHGLVFPCVSSVLTPLCLPHFQLSAQSQEQIPMWSYNGDWAWGVWWCSRLEGLVWIVCDHQHHVGSALCSCWLHASAASSCSSPSPCLPQWPATWSVWCVQTAPDPGYTRCSRGRKGAKWRQGANHKAHHAPDLTPEAFPRLGVWWRCDWKVGRRRGWDFVRQLRGDLTVKC